MKIILNLKYLTNSNIIDILSIVVLSTIKTQGSKLSQQIIEIINLINKILN